MDPTVKQQTIESLVGNYNETVLAVASGRGWSGSEWTVKGSFTTTPTTLPGNTGPKSTTTGDNAEGTSTAPFVKWDR